jgi:5-deoxy-glucuronate isomerase
MGQAKLLVHPSHAAEGVGHRITPASAGWRYVGFETRSLKQGAKSELDTGGDEICVVVLSGKARISAGEFDSGTIGERANVFDGLPWSVYLPPHTTATIEAASDCHVALCSAPASGKFKGRVIKPGDVGALTRWIGHKRAPCAQRPARRRRGRERASGRSHHARRPLVELSAAQARSRRAAGRILS